MKEIGKFEIKLRPVAWRLEQEDGRNILSKAAKRFQDSFRQSVKKQNLPDSPSTEEIGLFIDLFMRYDDSYRTPEKKPIPDMDHVVTLIQNALEGLLFEDDRQVAFLLTRRWKIPKGGSDSISVRVCQLDN